MNLTFAGIINQFVTVYLDNTIIYSETVEEHLAYIKKVFEQTRESFLYWKLKKYEFGRIELRYLGYRVGGGIVSMYN